MFEANLIILQQPRPDSVEGSADRGRVLALAFKSVRNPSLRGRKRDFSLAGGLLAA